MLVKQLLPEICHFIHTYREGHQYAAELRASASAVLFSLSCNNFNAVFSRISTRWLFLKEALNCCEWEVWRYAASPSDLRLAPAGYRS